MINLKGRMNKSSCFFSPNCGFVSFVKHKKEIYFCCFGPYVNKTTVKTSTKVSYFSANLILCCKEEEEKKNINMKLRKGFSVFAEPHRNPIKV